MLRRTSVLLLLTVVSCGSGASSVDERETSQLPATAFPGTISTSDLESVPWQPTANEPAPGVKVAAARALEAMLTYEEGGGTPEGASRRVTALGLPPQVAIDLAPLMVPAGSGSVQIVYPQLGGLTPTGASVMVVIQVVVIDDGGARATTRTLDVRLERTPAGWRTSSVASLGAPSSAVAEPSAAVQALVSDPGVDLPDSAIWDLQSGRIDPRVVALLTALSAEHELAVAVLAAGHPINVFDRDVVSNHTMGRGVDIWRVDGIAVAEQQQSPTLRALVDRALSAGATEIGAPFDTDGPGGKVFTNEVHRDHLHLAFDAPLPPPPSSVAP